MPSNDKNPQTNPNGPYGMDWFEVEGRIKQLIVAMHQEINERTIQFEQKSSMFTIDVDTMRSQLQLLNDAVFFKDPKNNKRIPERDGKMSIFWQQQEEMTQLKAS